ncbi:hypothetical protein Tco_1262580 [Tanacetum coccineum]
MADTWQDVCTMSYNASPGHDQPPFQILQMLYCFVNHAHIDNAELLSEGLHYALKHPSTLIPYLRFIKLTVGHYIIAFLEISGRIHDKYHNLEHDEMVKSVPTTQSQPIESTQGTHRTTSAPRSPNPDVAEGESSAQRKSTIIRLRIPPRRKVNEHLVAEEIEKIVEGMENVEEDVVDNYSLNSQNDPGTRLEPGSYKESSEVEIISSKQPVDVIEEEEESVEDDYELRRRVKGKDVTSVI